MAKHTLFIVHGMGTYAADWWQEVWDQLKLLSTQYPYFQNRDLEDLVDPVGITYDQHLQAARQRWQNQASAFADFATTNQLRHAADLDWLQGIADDDAGFLASHVADVIIYRFFKLEQGNIQDNVKKDVFERIHQGKLQDSSAEFSVLAHSLGTAVIHDALAEIARSATIDNKVNAFQAGNFSFRSIHMLANVSRLLQTDPKAYESVIRPGGRDSASSYCLRMYNHGHELDPFLIPKPFEPFGWGDMFSQEKIRHYRDWNIHSFAHYLDNPRVHIPLLKMITSSRAISRREAAAAVDAYPQFGGRFQVVPEVSAKLDEIAQKARALDEEKGLSENYHALMALWKSLGELKALIDAAQGGG